MKKLKHAEKEYAFPMLTWGMRHGAQGLDFTSLCSFPPANVPHSAFLCILEVSRVFMYFRASLCKFTFHKSQSFSSVSEQGAEQDMCVCVCIVASKWLFFFKSIHVLKAVLPSVEFRNLSLSLSPPLSSLPLPPSPTNPFLNFPETNSFPLLHPSLPADFGSVQKPPVSLASCISRPPWPAFYGVNQLLLFFFTLSPFPIHSTLLTLSLTPSPSWCVGLLNGVQSDFWHPINLNFQAWEARLTYWHLDK